MYFDTSCTGKNKQYQISYKHNLYRIAFRIFRVSLAKCYLGLLGPALRSLNILDLVVSRSATVSLPGKVIIGFAAALLLQTNIGIGRTVMEGNVVVSNVIKVVDL